MSRIAISVIDIPAFFCKITNREVSAHGSTLMLCATVSNVRTSPAQHVLRLKPTTSEGNRPRESSSSQSSNHAPAHPHVTFLFCEVSLQLLHTHLRNMGCAGSQHKAQETHLGYIAFCGPLPPPRLPFSTLCDGPQRLYAPLPRMGYPKSCSGSPVR